MNEIQCEQGTDLWLSLRRGRPTASRFSDIITPKEGKLSASSDAYMAELVAELLGWSSDFQGTNDTDRGHRLEDEAFRWLKFKMGLKARKTGICLSDCGRYAASPDGIIESDGSVLEIKAPNLKNFLLWKKQGTLPIQHKAQVHGQLAVTGAPRAIFLAYADHEALDNLVIEVRPDDFTKRVRDAVETFCGNLETFRREALGEEEEFYQPVKP